MLRTIQECWTWYRSVGDHLTPSSAWPSEFGLDVRMEDVMGAGSRTDDAARLERLVPQVCEARRRCLAAKGDPVHSGDWRADGRLLLYSPSDSLSEGYSAVVSDGVFDVCDCPGFGLWVDFLRPAPQQSVHVCGTLVAYVPSGLIPLVDQGIDGNSTACIAWADCEADAPSVAAYLRSLDAQSSG